jgi:hypothetical protein
MWLGRHDAGMCSAEPLLQQYVCIALCDARGSRRF